MNRCNGIGYMLTSTCVRLANYYYPVSYITSIHSLPRLDMFRGHPFSSASAPNFLFDPAVFNTILQYILYHL
jgi:hypothetical protein